MGVHAGLTTESLGVARPEPPPSSGPPPTRTPPAALVTAYPNLFPVVGEIPCLHCENPDPVEDTRVQLPPGTSLWICHRCNERWAFITTAAGGEGIIENTEQALFDVLNAVRVALSVENYHIQDMAASSQVFRIFERQDPQSSSGLMVVYAGIPVRNVPSFTMENPANALLRIRLGGGPEHRMAPPPRRPVLVSEEPHLASVGPLTPVAVGYVDGTTGANISAPRPFTTPVEASHTATSELLAEMNPAPFIAKGTRWVTRSSGELVEISHMGKSADGDAVVHFRPVSDDVSASTLLLQRDFEAMHRPLTPEPGYREEAVVEILKDEEWEHIESGETVRIDEVDTKRNLVIVAAKDRRRTVRMIDFVNNKWRRIVRKTSFARLMEDD